MKKKIIKIIWSIVQYPAALFVVLAGAVIVIAEEVEDYIKD